MLFKDYNNSDEAIMHSVSKKVNTGHSSCQESDGAMPVTNSENIAKSKVPYNVFAGGLKYIAEDFDETPDVFDEYIGKDAHDSSIPK